MNVLIVEDETAAAANLKAILRSIEPSYDVLAVLESVEETIDYFRDESRPASRSAYSIRSTSPRPSCSPPHTTNMP